MLETIRKNITKLIQKGKSLEEVNEAKPTAKFDAKNTLFVPADNFVRIVYQDLAGES